MTSLTKGQELFARAYVEIGNARQAYAMAGYSQKNSLATQQKEAHKLLHHPMVVPRALSRLLVCCAKMDDVSVFHAAAVTAFHLFIASVRNWRNVLREIRWR